MNFKPGALYILIFLLFCSLPLIFAQKAGKGNNAHNSIDSASQARQHYTDSLKEARINKTDSLKEIRLKALDSVKAARALQMDSVKGIRKHFADSLAYAHRYKNSRHYLDSVSKSRSKKIVLAQKQRKAAIDSVKTARKTTLDKAVAIRKTRIDSIHKIQKRRTDSMAVIRRYKQSKRYFDSVSIVRHARMDSMHVMRKKFNDSMLVVRKFKKDSTTKVRKHTMDSIKVVRNKYIDSIKSIRKARADSLAKIKADKEKLLKAQQAAKEKKLMMALDLKIKQKREKWSNESMLKKKWRAPRTYLQNTVTRYNYYFNANKKMDEALANMQRGRKDNFDSLIGIYPFDPNKDSSMLLADMDSIIHKVSVGIQIHDPRTKWADDLYLLLGEAYYYKGGYENAATSFRYIISMDEQQKKDEAAKTPSKSKGPSIVENDKKSRLDFLKHQPVHNDAILWLARTYTESHQVENAESILSLLDSDPNLPDNLQGRLALEKAFVHLSDHNYPDASNELAVVAKDNNIPEWIRVRCAFINGQLLQKETKYTASTESFKKVLDYNPKIDMEFYARKYMAYNAMYAGGDVSGMINSLEKVLNDGKYIPYYDQVYYLLGQLAANNNNTEDAVAYLKKSINTPKATKKQKAISFATLGNVYFADGEYLDAKNAYDSSVKYASGASKDGVVIVAMKRSKVLGEVSAPLTLIHDLDSLLDLATLNDKEQKAAVRRYLRYLERKRADSIYKAENAGVNSVQLNENQEATSWYFSNPVQMQQGYNAFKQKWGNRPLADNWRRISGMGANTFANTNADSSSETEQSITLDENGLPTEESLLAFIPNTPEAQDKAQKKIQKAFIDLTDAYIKELEDYPLALRTLDTLDKRYPDHIYKESELYMRYLIAIRQGKLDQTTVYSSQILRQFPDSKYAALVRPTEDRAGKVDTGVTVSNFYDETYGLLIQYQYTDVLARVREARKKYKDTVFQKRFHIMEAIALAGSGNYKQADTLLKEFLKVNPSDSLKVWADDLIKYLSKNPAMPLAGSNTGPLQSHWPYYGQPLGKPSGFLNDLNPADSSAKGNVNIRHSDTVFASTQEDKAIKAAQPLPALIEYSYKPDAQQYVGILLPGMEYRLAKLRAAVKDIDAARFPNASVFIDLLKPDQAIMLVKTFTDMNEAKSYLAALAEDTDIFKEYKPNEFQLFIISANDYKKLLFDRDISAYLDFYSRNFK